MEIFRNLSIDEFAPVKTVTVILDLKSRFGFSNCIADMDPSFPISRIRISLCDKLKNILSACKPLCLVCIGDSKISVFKGVGKEFHQSHLKLVSVVGRNSVCVVEIAYKKVCVETDVHRIVGTVEGTVFHSADDVLHSAVKKELLVLPQDPEDTCKMSLEILNCEDRNHVVVLKFLKGLNLTCTGTDSDDSAIMEPGVTFDGIKNFFAANFL